MRGDLENDIFPTLRWRRRRRRARTERRDRNAEVRRRVRERKERGREWNEKIWDRCMHPNGRDDIVTRRSIHYATTDWTFIFSRGIPECTSNTPRALLPRYPSTVTSSLPSQVTGHRFTTRRAVRARPRALRRRRAACPAAQYCR